MNNETVDFPADGNPDQPTDEELDHLLADLFDRMDRGQPIDRESFARLNPRMQQEVRALLEVSDFVEDAVQKSDVSSYLKVPPPGVSSVEESASRSNDSSVQNPGPATEDAGGSSTVLYKDADSPEQSDGEEPDDQGFGSISIEHIGDYELQELLGRGGMGLVYKARQISLNRIVALKMILSGKMASRDELERFYSEARAVARLRHPNIVAVHDFREDDGHHYFSMEYVQGCTLDEVAQRETLSEKQIARYINLIAEAVEYAHQNGVLHRDLKPANVLVDLDDQPHVTDFGLAKHLEEDSGLTSQGTILGTPSYMSPEQAAGLNSETGTTSDVYSLGAILYFLLTGKPPFRGKNAVETVSLVINTEVQPVRTHRPKVSRALAIICEKCLRKDPAERYQSAQELAVELERFLRGDPIQARPISRLRRCWIWCRDIPLVAGLIGRTPSPANQWQTRLQWLLLMFGCVSGMVWATLAVRASMLPDEIVIAAGLPDGMYDGVSQRLQESLQTATGTPVRVLKTQGSIENRDLIFAREAHLGLLQESAVDIEQVAVIAPLYREFVFVIVRRESDFETIADLDGRTILIGASGSGNRVSAEKILGKFHITSASASFNAGNFDQLGTNMACDAAIVITGLQNASLNAFLATGKFRLLPIPPRVEISLGTGFFPDTIKPEDFAGIIKLDDDGLATVITPALLVVRKGERNSLVEAVCESLWNDGLIDTLPGKFSPEQFRDLTKALPMHPAAIRYFRTHPVEQADKSQ